MHLIYHPDAETELLEAAQFYEGRVQGLGDRFLDEFAAALTKILEIPDS